MIEITSITRQILNFNRNAFNSIYDSTLMMQNQSEQITNSFIKASPIIPPEGKQAIDEWILTFKNGSQDFKKLIDDNFDKLEKVLVK